MSLSLSLCHRFFHEHHLHPPTPPPRACDRQTLTFEYEVAEGDLTDSLAYSDRHALVFGFNATFGSSGYESKLRSLVAQASTSPTVAAEKVRT